MSIFNVNFKILWEQLTPPLLRKPLENAWGEALMAPMDNNNVLFNEYMTGSTYNTYSSGITYSASNRVIYVDNSVYESFTGSTNIMPTDINSWFKVNDTYIGAIERSSYNGQKYLFEYALNRYFQVSGTSRTSQYGTSYNNIWIETLAPSSSFLMGHTGPYSSNLVNNSVNATSYLTNTYSATTSDYIIWVPNYIYSGTTQPYIRAFADKYNIAGMTYQVINY